MRKYQEISLEDDDAGFAAYLVVDPTDREISFGGTRIDMSVTRDVVVDLADNMSLKLAGHGSPVGGAKAGLRASPDDPRLKRFLGQFAEACRDVLSSTTILGKDMGAKQWMLDEIYRCLQMPQLEVAWKRHRRTTECPKRLSELHGYIKNMTGQGVFWSIEQALGGTVRGARILIQGFGVVGAGVAWHLDRFGAKIVGVSDCNKAVLCAPGMDVDALMAAKDDNGLLAESQLPRSCMLADRDELLGQQADVLVLAAGSHVVDGAIAARIQALFVIEAANLAVMPAGREVLHARAIRVVPDVVANSASAAMVASQIASGNTTSPKELWAGIEASIKRNTAAVGTASLRLNIEPKSAFRQLMEAESSRNPSR